MTQPQDDTVWAYPAYADDYDWRYAVQTPPEPTPPQEPEEPPPPRRASRIPLAVLTTVAVGALVALAVVSVGRPADRAATAAAPTRTTASVPPTPPSASEPDPMDRSTYPPVTADELAALVADPESARGRRMVLYGYVAQIGGVVGTEGFRAFVGPPSNGRYDHYTQNAVMSSYDSSILVGLVKDDKVTMYVEGLGSYDYETVSGERLTVPRFGIRMVEVTG